MEAERKEEIKKELAKPKVQTIKDEPVKVEPTKPVVKAEPSSSNPFVKAESTKPVVKAEPSSSNPFVKAESVTQDSEDKLTTLKKELNKAGHSGLKVDALIIIIII